MGVDQLVAVQRVAIGGVGPGRGDLDGRHAGLDLGDLGAGLATALDVDGRVVGRGGVVAPLLVGASDVDAVVRAVEAEVQVLEDLELGVRCRSGRAHGGVQVAVRVGRLGDDGGRCRSRRLLGVAMAGCRGDADASEHGQGQGCRCSVAGDGLDDTHGYVFSLLGMYESGCAFVM